MAENWPSVERLDIHFKKRIARAQNEHDEKAVRNEWREIRTRLYGEPPQLEPNSDPESFETTQQLQRFFKRKIARATNKSEASEIRELWSAAEAEFWGQLAARTDAKAKAIEDANSEQEARETAEGEAWEAARKGYGPAVGASGDVRHVYADPPTPIEAHWPRVEIITEPKESQ